MAEEKIPEIMREFVGTMASGDVEKTLSFLTDDATWVAPAGTFTGTADLRRIMTWMAESMEDMTITESGLGIIAQGDKAFFEHVIGGTMEGQRCEVLAICAYEFAGDKIQNVRTTFDRLSMAQQAAKGWLPKWVVGKVVGQAQKGL